MGLVERRTVKQLRDKLKKTILSRDSVQRILQGLLPTQELVDLVAEVVDTRHRVLGFGVDVLADFVMILDRLMHIHNSVVHQTLCAIPCVPSAACDAVEKVVDVVTFETAGCFGDWDCELGTYLACWRERRPYETFPG